MTFDVDLEWGDLLEHLGDAVTVIGPDWRYRWVSTGMAALLGRPRSELVGADVWAVFPEVVGSPEHDLSLEAMRSGKPVEFVWYYAPAARYIEQRVIPTRRGMVVVARDVTDREQAAEYSRRLLLIGQQLAGTMSSAEVLAVLSRLVFPLVEASGGGIVLADPERQVMRSLGWSGADATMARAWAEYPLDVRTPGTDAYRSGEPVLLPDIDAAAAGYPDLTADLRRVGRPAIAALPLVAAAERMGALVCNFATPRAFGDAEIRFLSTVAAMCAQSVARSRLFEDEQAGIATLQRSLLPQMVEQPVGARIAARYRSGGAGVDVGGDWWDVIPLPGAVGLVMGDVEGHDLAAAAIMGQVRSAVRAYALEGHPPRVVLERANDFLASLRLERLVTVAYLQVHPNELLVTAVSAGHLPALVAAPGHQVSEVPDRTGPPLGVLPAGNHWPEVTSTVPGGAVLAMFTDGLVEQRGFDIDAGMSRVAAALHAHLAADGERIADAIVAAGLRGRAAADDLALLIVQLPTPATPPGRPVRRRLPATAASVPLARHFLTDLLAAWEVHGPAVRTAELLLSEVVTNATRHSEDDIELRLAVQNGRLRVEVSDSSHRDPVVLDASADDTSGRGLFTVESLAERWGVESTGLGKVVWFEVPTDSSLG